MNKIYIVLNTIKEFSTVAFITSSKDEYEKAIRDFTDPNHEVRGYELDDIHFQDFWVTTHPERSGR